jgi:hypothetical protein
VRLGWRIAAEKNCTRTNPRTTELQRGERVHVELKRVRARVAASRALVVDDVDIAVWKTHDEIHRAAKRHGELRRFDCEHECALAPHLGVRVAYRAGGIAS